MQHARIGSTDLEVSPISLGSFHTYDRIGARKAAELIRHAVDSGVNWFDVGHYTWLQPVPITDVIFAQACELAGIHRDEIVITEKLWYGGFQHTFRAQLNESLPRAGVDHADIVIENADTAYDRARADQEYRDQLRHMMQDIVLQMGELIEDGYARYWGINECTARQLRQACEFADREGLPKPVVLQIGYNAVERELGENKELMAVARDYGIPVQASNVLAAGVLAGRAPKDATRPLGTESMMRTAWDDIAAFSRVAEEFGASPAQLAIAFCLANEDVVSALAGVSRIDQLDDDIKAVDLLGRVGADAIREALADLPQNPDQRGANVSAAGPLSTKLITEPLEWI